MERDFFNKIAEGGQIAGSDGCRFVDGRGFKDQIVRIRTQAGQYDLMGSRVECLVISEYPRRLEFICNNPPENYPFLCSEVTSITTYSNHDTTPPKAPTLESRHSQN